MVIEPYEVNEIRFLNNLTPAAYESLSAACLDHFATSSQPGGVPCRKSFHHHHDLGTNNRIRALRFVDSYLSDIIYPNY
jgi:hypothetical protein